MAGFKAEALGFAGQAGMADTAKRLSQHELQIYAWRKGVRYVADRSDTEKELSIENARYKRQVAKMDISAHWTLK